MTSKMILVVDDNADSRDVVAAFLRHHGYRVLEAGGGAEAIRRAREQRPDAILLDMMMSAPDGWAVTDHLKHDPETARIPIIALTVCDTEEDQERALEAGVDGYLIKPCLPADILEEVRQFVGPGTEAPE